MNYFITILLLLCFASEYRADENNYYEVEKKVLFTGTNTIALVKKSESYQGGAHGMTIHIYKNYDKNDNTLITWKKLFGSNEKLFLYIYTQVEKTLIEDDYLEDLTPQEKMKRITQFKKVGNFSILKKGLYIEFPLYTIAPYVYGHKSLLIKKEILQIYMNKEDYKYYFNDI